MALKADLIAARALIEAAPGRPVSAALLAATENDRDNRAWLALCALRHEMPGGYETVADYGRVATSAEIDALFDRAIKSAPPTVTR